MKIQPDIATILGLAQPAQHPPLVHAHTERSAEQQAHDRREFSVHMAVLVFFVILATALAKALGV